MPLLKMSWHLLGFGFRIRCVMVNPYFVSTLTLERKKNVQRTDIGTDTDLVCRLSIVDCRLSIVEHGNY